MAMACRVNGTAEIAEERLRRLYEYWNQKRGDRLAPGGAEIDPLEIPDLLGYVNIFDVESEPRDFRVRLHGSKVTEMLGREITGKLVSEVMSGREAELFRDAFDICIDEWTPAAVETSLAFCGRPYAVQTLIALPLSADGRLVNRIITAHCCHIPTTSLEIAALDEAAHG